MKSFLSNRIESYLFSYGGWVSSRNLCERFGITERQLRQIGNRPGLCSGFAVSSDKGFKHVSRATKGEYIRFKHRLRRHAIAELVRVRTLDKRRHNVTAMYKDAVEEKDTNQLIFL